MDYSNAQLTMTVLMTPDKANFTGNVHGGADHILDVAVTVRPIEL